MVCQNGNRTSALEIELTEILKVCAALAETIIPPAGLIISIPTSLFFVIANATIQKKYEPADEMKINELLENIKNKFDHSKPNITNEIQNFIIDIKESANGSNVESNIKYLWEFDDNNVTKYYDESCLIADKCSHSFELKLSLYYNFASKNASVGYDNLKFNLNLNQSIMTVSPRKHFFENLLNTYKVFVSIPLYINVILIKYIC